MKKEFVLTADGSHSIYLPDMDEHYHSIHGAIAESTHIFIQSGLLEMAKTKQEIKLFEVGMGTGLNVLMTVLAAAKEKLQLNYHTIEAYPLSIKEISLLNYMKHLDEEGAEKILLDIHQAAWDIEVPLCNNFLLKKYHANLLAFDTAEKFDLIYFDAFAPEKQAEMWDIKVFEKIIAWMNTGAILVTYCVKGEVRRKLQSLGLAIEKIPGPIGGKREILRARK